MIFFKTFELSIKPCSVNVAFEVMKAHLRLFQHKYRFIHPMLCLHSACEQGAEQKE